MLIDTARLAVADDLAAAKLPADMAAPMDKPTAFKKRAEAMAAAEKMAAAIGIETRAVADLDLPNYLFNQL